MPRRQLRFSRRRGLDDGLLDEDLRLCLEQWHGCLGLDLSLRTRQDWADAWARWGDVLLPEYVADRPGCRPAAMYAAGLLPARPLEQPLSTGHGFVSVFVADRGGGQWHYQAWEPYMRCEAAFLLEHGVIDKAEYRRHLRHDRAHAWRCVWPWDEGGIAHRK